MKFYLQRQELSSRGDLIGILLSVACMFHCVAIPVLTFTAPAMAAHSEHEWIHLAFLAAVIPIALFSFIPSTKIHKSTKPMAWGLAGVSLLIAGILLEGFAVFGFELEMALTVLGSLCLCVAHFCNHSLKKCACSHC